MDASEIDLTDGLTLNTADVQKLAALTVELQQLHPGATDVTVTYHPRTNRITWRLFNQDSPSSIPTD